MGSTIFNPIRGLLKTQENYLKHDNLTSLEHGLVQIAQGHNWAVYLPVRPACLVTNNCEELSALHAANNLVFKANKVTIPKEQVKDMQGNIQFIKDVYSELRKFAAKYDLNIPDFQIELIEDRKGKYRLVYAEPDIGALFKDPAVIDLAYEKFRNKNPEQILKDKKALESIGKLIDLCGDFHDFSKKELKRPMHLDIWGETNIVGVKDNAVFTEHGIKKADFKDTRLSDILGYPLVANSSLIKANTPQRLFNERKDFQLIISQVLESLKRITDEKNLKNPLGREFLYLAAKLKSTLSKKTGVV